MCQWGSCITIEMVHIKPWCTIAILSYMYYKMTAMLVHRKAMTGKDYTGYVMFWSLTEYIMHYVALSASHNRNADISYSISLQFRHPRASPSHIILSCKISFPEVQFSTL